MNFYTNIPNLKKKFGGGGGWELVAGWGVAGEGGLE